VSEKTEQRVQRVLERELAHVDSPETAAQVVEQAEQLAGGATEQDAAEHAKNEPLPADVALLQATRQAPREERSAVVLAEAAAQAVAPTAEAPAVVKGAQAALGPTPSPPEAERGRALLQEAALQRMSPRDSLDARLFLAINNLPHGRLGDRATDLITIACRGGWIWALAVGVARLRGVPCTGPALLELLPCVAGATLIVEHPIKAYFRRRRPFVDVIRAVVIGKKPGSWSFPSGHTTSSFAAATVLAARWPRRAPIFFGVAAGVGLSRIYAGAHYPGDVLSGAWMGITLAGALRTVVRILLGSRLR
jgi:undecaprenyl-diphosphatase